MNELEQLRRLWLQLRGDYQQRLLDDLNDGNAVDQRKLAQQLANLHQIVQQALDAFKPQG